MSFLKGATPIVRGECDACGMVRNLWVSELGSETGTPCDHGDRGCRGIMQIVYRGPKAWLPREYDHGWCNCGGVPGPAPAAGSGSAPSGASAEALDQLQDMGFERAAAKEALARGGGDVPAALDVLMNPAEAPDGANQAATSASTCSSCAPAGPGAAEDMGECAICVEELLLADAAMRCSGHGGKQHYFHAHCLTAWIRECRRTGKAPTCPECRGPVQVRPRRLQEFMQRRGDQLNREDKDTIRSIVEAVAGEVDDEGWSEFKSQLMTGAAIVGLGAVAAIAVAGVVKALGGSLSSSDRREDERRS